MSRETKYHAVVLKKQAFGESDEIITLFSKERGKIRCLAKSVKLPKSKLQQKLQVLFLVNLTLTHGQLPKIISAEPEEVFAKIRENLASMKLAFYITELVLKFTPDEQKNEPLFFLLKEVLDFLSSRVDQAHVDLGLAKFKISILELSGLGIHDISDFRTQASPGAYQLFKALKEEDFGSLTTPPKAVNLTELQQLLSDFIEYQLERKIKSEKYLRQKM